MKRFLYIISVLCIIKFSLSAIGQALAQVGTCDPSNCAGPCLLNAIPGMCLGNGMECNCIISTPQPPNLH